ncbi:MAG: hypothetical protein WCS37_22920, partial [Chloroflexota bacterium]
RGRGVLHTPEMKPDYGQPNAGLFNKPLPKFRGRGVLHTPEMKPDYGQPTAGLFNKPLLIEMIQMNSTPA